MKGKDYKVKELVIKPHSELSMQRHEHRSETWNLVSGNAKLRLIQHGEVVEHDLVIYYSYTQRHMASRI